jgi:hypothetical protein
MVASVWLQVYSFYKVCRPRQIDLHFFIHPHTIPVGVAWDESPLVPQLQMCLLYWPLMTDEYAVGGMTLSRGKLKYSYKNLLQYHFHMTDPTSTALGMNPDLCSKKPATSHQTYGMDSIHSKKDICWQVENYYMQYVLHKNFDFSTAKRYFELISWGFHSFSFKYDFGFWE